MTEVIFATLDDVAVQNTLVVRIPAYVSGVPQSGETIFRYIFTDEVEVVAGLLESQGIVLVAPAAEAVFSYLRNGVEFGTATFPIGVTTATFGGAGATFAIGDVLSLTAPAPADIDLAGVSLTLAGIRVV